jgi:hypothetical protein
MSITQNITHFKKYGNDIMLSFFNNSSKHQMFDRIKKILSVKKLLSVFVVPFFVVSVTAVVVLLLAYNMGIKFANNILQRVKAVPFFK